MTLSTVTPNCHILERDDGSRIVFSYETPVAVYERRFGWCCAEVRPPPTGHHISKAAVTAPKDMPQYPQDFFDHYGE